MKAMAEVNKSVPAPNLGMSDRLISLFLPKYSDLPPGWESVQTNWPAESTSGCNSWSLWNFHIMFCQLFLVRYHCKYHGWCQWYLTNVTWMIRILNPAGKNMSVNSSEAAYHSVKICCFFLKMPRWKPNCLHLGLRFFLTFTHITSWYISLTEVVAVDDSSSDPDKPVTAAVEPRMDGKRLSAKQRIGSGGGGGSGAVSSLRGQQQQRYQRSGGVRDLAQRLNSGRRSPDYKRRKSRSLSRSRSRSPLDYDGKTWNHWIVLYGNCNTE